MLWAIVIFLFGVLLFYPLLDIIINRIDKWWENGGPLERERTTIGTRLHRVYFWLWDGQYDYLVKRKSKLEFLYAFHELCIENPGKWLLCKIYGHEFYTDQCGRPEHDYCGWCGKVFPYTARRS